jgi:hypothetical protein
MVSGRMIARAIVQCLGPAAPGFITQRSSPRGQSKPTRHACTLSSSAGREESVDEESVEGVQGCETDGSAFTLAPDEMCPYVPISDSLYEPVSVKCLVARFARGRHSSNLARVR